jgi:hypothetical protein
LFKQDLEDEMSSIVIGYRQLEVNQLEIHKPSVARFEWKLLGANQAVVARGEILVFGEQAKVEGWEAGMEYWYVSSLGVAAAPIRFTVECKELVPIDQAKSIIGRHTPQDAFVASMVPEPQRLQAGDPVLSLATVQGQFRAGTTSAISAADAALWIELDGHQIKRIDWYWSATTPLSLFPGGAKVGDKVELKQTANGTPGFPQVGWSKSQHGRGAVAASP